MSVLPVKHDITIYRGDDFEEDIAELYDPNTGNIWDFTDWDLTSVARVAPTSSDIMVTFAVIINPPLVSISADGADTISVSKGVWDIQMVNTVTGEGPYTIKYGDVYYEEQVTI